MSAKTSIQWTDRTWNPVRGCTRVSEGCRNCYAERMASRGFSWSKGFAKSTPAGPRWTGKVALIPEALDEPLRWRKPQRVFVNSMSDLFHESLGDEAVGAVFGAMAAAPQHTFQVLTKRPERMRRWLSGATLDGCITMLARFVRAPQQAKTTRRVVAHGDFRQARQIGTAHHARWPLPNIWLGVSVEDQATADERIPLLLQTPAAVRFVSYEPALGPVDFRRHFEETFQLIDPIDDHVDLTKPGPRIHWLICGGESGPGARPFDLAWARSAIAQCKAAGIPCFVKQLGARPTCSPEERQGTEVGLNRATKRWTLDAGRPVLLLRDRKGGDMSEWPSDLRIREFPKVAT